MTNMDKLSGVLKEMTVEEMQIAHVKLQEVMREKVEKDRQAAKNKFVETVEFQKIAKSYLELKEVFNKVVKKKNKTKTKVEVEITLDTVLKEDSLDDALDYSYGRGKHVDDFLKINGTGKLLNARKYDTGFKETMQYTIDAALDNACSEILQVCPEREKELSGFLSKFNELSKRMHANNLKSKDLKK